MIPKMQRFPRYPLTAPALALACLATGSPAKAETAVPTKAGIRSEDGKFILHAAAWSQYGQIAKSLDTADGMELGRKGMLGTGAQFALHYQANERLQVNAGLGVAAGHSIAASPTFGYYAPLGMAPYVAEANASYAFLDGDTYRLSARAGLFPYDYAPESQNLGLYLLRGPVYPGFLTSGFETKYVLPVANTFGFQVHNRLGAFEQDFLLTFDTDWFPYWDMSPAYVASLHFGKAARIGGGAQFYHYIPIDPELTTQKTDEVRYIDASDPAAPETTYISFKGIKLMADFAFDPKAAMGWEAGSGALGPEDLKLYGELALLGLDGDKAHKDLYGALSKRMPMMAGFNLPAFGILDRLNLELEYYGAPWVDDPSIYYHLSGPKPTPIPKKSGVDTNTTKDNLKWSIYASKILANHVKISAQVASDHSRPGIFQGYGDNLPPSTIVPFSSPSEWYWMTKVAYFF